MKKILVVDDSPEDRELLAEFASNWDGFEARIVATGREAVDELEQSPYSCVILDYILDGEDGFDVLRDMRELRPQTAVIMLTGEGGSMVEAASIRAGIARYLPKRGLTESALLSAINLAILASERAEEETE